MVSKAVEASRPPLPSEGGGGEGGCHGGWEGGEGEGLDNGTYVAGESASGHNCYGSSSRLQSVWWGLPCMGFRACG
jgi:hypothetical protein